MTRTPPPTALPDPHRRRSLQWLAGTATAMAWEAGQTHSARRMRLAQWVLRQRLLPQDPLAQDGEPDWLPALLEPGAAPATEAVATINLL